LEKENFHDIHEKKKVADNTPEIANIPIGAAGSIVVGVDDGNERTSNLQPIR